MSRDDMEAHTSHSGGKCYHGSGCSSFLHSVCKHKFPRAGEMAEHLRTLIVLHKIWVKFPESTWGGGTGKLI